MDALEKIGYAILAVVAACWLGFVIFGVIAALPYGLIGLLAIAGFGVLFVKVLRERLGNKDDDYYSKHVDR